jgi:D-aminoacyl-tRNA deacylase
MKVVVQRCDQAKITVNQKIVGQINNGLTLLVGFTEGDNEKTINYMVNKIINLRVFDDDDKVMNKSILDVKGQLLSISQFTLYGDSSKGNRPSYSKALNGEKAIKLYQLFNNKLKEYVDVQEGLFGAEMIVEITNNGPVTIIIERGNNEK